MEQPLMTRSPVNLSPFGLDNGLGYEGGAEVFHPVADPSGLITCTVTRK
jgi:urate oxidase